MVAPFEASAALAAAAAVSAAIRRQDARLFEGCARPSDGLDVEIFPSTERGLYFVQVHQQFRRCGDGPVRALDWSPLCAVTADGVVLECAPPPF
jgi:hypothetical protein